MTNHHSKNPPRHGRGFMFPALLLAGVTIVSACLSPSAPHGPWGYEGEFGPEHWASLDASFTACGAGQAQSPVDLVGATGAGLNELELDYHAITPTLVNDGHTMEVHYPAGSELNIEGTHYELEQYHFHSPSEHTINGRSYAGELHLVHQSATGELAVLGVLLEEGAHNDAYEPLFAATPREFHDEVTLTGVHNVASLLPAGPGDLQTLRYSGSLTTPPCTEGVRWNVVATPVEVSSEQLGRFRWVFPGNARPTQPLNGRAILTEN